MLFSYENNTEEKMKLASISGFITIVKYIEKQPARNFKTETTFLKFMKFIDINQFTTPPTQQTFYAENYL